MPQHLKLFYIALITFVFTRLVLLVTWQSTFMEGQKADDWHHFYLGLILVVLGYVTKKNHKLLLVGMGLGLMLDEATVPLKLLIIEYVSTNF